MMINRYTTLYLTLEMTILPQRNTTELHTPTDTLRVLHTVAKGDIRKHATSNHEKTDTFANNTVEPNESSSDQIKVKPVLMSHHQYRLYLVFV